MDCRLALILTVSIGLAPPLVARTAWAAPGETESDDDRRAAAKLFGEGQKAYNAGDYRHAAESFEEAYRRAPRLAPLWNAARAWHKAREYVRAANLYAKYLSLAPPDAPDRNSATSAMRDLEPKLGRLEIHAPSFDSVSVDGSRIETDAAEAVVYVTPGSHLIEGTSHGKTAIEKPLVEAGSSASIVLTLPAEPVASPTSAPSTPVTAPPREETRSGLSPVVFAIGAGLTAVGLGLTVWSGVDTMNQKQTFNGAPTQANLDEGKARELRTNVFIGVTASLATLTTIVAFFVNWKGHAATRVGLGLDGVVLRGAF